MTARVIVCSDRASRADAADRTGPALVERLGELGLSAGVGVVPDDRGAIADAVRDAIDSGARLVVLAGGTGVGPRDVTPEAVAGLGGRHLPGFGERMRAVGRASTPRADLSRGGAVALGQSLVLMLPGSPRGALESLGAVAELIPHALDVMAGGDHPSELPSPGDWVSADPVDTAAVVRSVHHPAAGATATFEGRVRDHDEGRGVIALRYEAHPGASEVLREVVAEAAGRDGVRGVAARHRVGDLWVGDLAFFVAVAADHRQEAFATCSWLVDEAKRRLPIWKHQQFADGESSWVNAP